MCSTYYTEFRKTMSIGCENSNYSEYNTISELRSYTMMRILTPSIQSHLHARAPVVGLSTLQLKYQVKSLEFQAQGDVTLSSPFPLQPTRRRHRRRVPPVHFLLPLAPGLPSSTLASPPSPRPLLTGMSCPSGYSLAPPRLKGAPRLLVASPIRR
jgi:hypothetical protein